ncbi:hypothetical protein IEQ34_001377 [Dendrobium chrysotoxum]|uniref:Uncharacterized protein n=1 Tax=Dendrobium chrysotoxum TaxID=161865 RepID=A0AAV7HPW4_DENCH|nr:hypothetical protein IEQ34_001377 [Dendrobium chrysotoxum]
MRTSKRRKRREGELECLMNPMPFSFSPHSLYSQTSMPARAEEIPSVAEFYRAQGMSNSRLLLVAILWNFQIWGTAGRCLAFLLYCLFQLLSTLLGVSAFVLF